MACLPKESSRPSVSDPTKPHAVAGDPDTATAAYKDFLTLWKDADPDIPTYQEAKAEYAKLQ